MHTAPAASRAEEKSTRASHHRYAETPGHSLRNGFNGLSSCSPRCPGLLATVACGITRRLDTSVGVSGPHDFAVRIVSLALRYQRVHRILYQRPWRTRVRPSWWDRTARLSAPDLPDGTTRIFFVKGMDRFSRAPPDLPVGQITRRSIARQFHPGYACPRANGGGRCAPGREG